MSFYKGEEVEIIKENYLVIFGEMIYYLID